MKNILLLFIAGSFACTPVYIPNSRSVPLFEEAGEIALDGYVGTSGFDLNVGASLSDHVALIGNISYADQDEPESEDFHQHTFGEIGIGYFNTNEGKLYTEFFGGYGMGESTSYDEYVFISPDEEKTTGNYNRVFAQGTIGFKPGPVELGASVRLSYVTFTKFETSTVSYTRSRTATFAEPVFFFKVGDPVHFNLQAGFNVPLEETISFDYRFMHFSLGVGARLKL